MECVRSFPAALLQMTGRHHVLVMLQGANITGAYNSPIVLERTTTSGSA